MRPATELCIVHTICIVHIIVTQTLPAPAPTAAPVRPNAIVVVLAFAGVTAAIMQTLVIPLIGDLPRLLDTSASNASWVITATLLAAAIATPISGRLGDLYGKRRIMLICATPAGRRLGALRASRRR